jgi:hypothetical protein
MSHDRKPIASACHVIREHALFLQECFFDFVFLLSAVDGRIEQCICMNFCVKLGKSATEIIEMLSEALGEHSLSRTAVFEWYSRFKATGVSVEDDEFSGRPSASKTTENVEKIENSSMKTVA